MSEEFEFGSAGAGRKSGLGRALQAAMLCGAIVIPCQAYALGPIDDVEKALKSGFSSVQKLLKDVQKELGSIGGNATATKKTIDELQHSIDTLESVSTQVENLVVHGETLIQYYADGEAKELEAFVADADGCATACETFRGELADFIVSTGNTLQGAMTLSEALFGVDLPSTEPLPDLATIDFTGLAGLIREVPGIVLFPAFKLLSVLEPGAPGGTSSTTNAKVMHKIETCDPSGCMGILSKLTRSNQVFTATSGGLGSSVASFVSDCATAVQPDVQEDMRVISVTYGIQGVVYQLIGGILSAAGETSLDGASGGLAAGANATVKLKTNTTGQLGKLLTKIGDVYSGVSSYINRRTYNCRVLVNQEILICMTAETSKGASAAYTGDDLIDHCRAGLSGI